jgi:ribonuclease P protein component
MPGPQQGTGQRLPSAEKLRRRADYLLCYRTGRRRHGAPAILYFVANQVGHPRLGITASRKVGNAVVRHKLKRRVKEIYRRWPHRGQLPALDLVVHLKPEAGGADFRSLRTELLRLLSSVGQTGQTGQSGPKREPAG